MPFNVGLCDGRLKKQAIRTLCTNYRRRCVLRGRASKLYYSPLLFRLLNSESPMRESTNAGQNSPDGVQGNRVSQKGKAKIINPSVPWPLLAKIQSIAEKPWRITSSPT